MINQKKLAVYLKNGLNVILEGAHGVGKTAVVKQVFEEANLNWKYYSAATMDPWVDFIGVPKTVKDSNGNDVLELVKPSELANDTVEAIFFDEFNRAPSKVMNAVMELIQFGSINGRKFNNLKVVWAAINPFDEDGTYSVESIDPAILDRFHINIKVPYELDTGYLFKTYGATSKPFVKWWHELPKELKFKVSPRRLDYAIKISSFGGDLHDVLPKETNIKKLYTLIKENQDNLVIEKIMSLSDEDKKTFFTLENTERFAERVLLEPNGKNLLPLFNKEFIESKIQLQNTDNLTTVIINAFLDDDDKLASVSKSSQEVLESIKKRRSEVSRVSLTKQHFHAIQNMVRLSIKYSNKTFLERLYPTFSDFLGVLKTKKSKDIPSYFEAVFTTTDDKGVSLLDDILQKLYTPFKTISQSLPDDHLSFVGLMYNFASKYANTQQKTKLEGFVKQVFAASFKNRNNYNKSAEEFVFTYNECNWVFFKETPQALKGLKSFQPFKDFLVNHRDNKNNVFDICTPSSIDDSIEFFCKESVDAIVKSAIQIKSSSKKKVSSLSDVDVSDELYVYKNQGTDYDDWALSEIDDYDRPEKFYSPKNSR